MAESRVPFAEAILEKRLLAPCLAAMSMPQRVALKAMYGCDLDGRVRDDRGFTELDYWAAFQGNGEYDELGYLLSVRPLPYTPQEYTEAWGIEGIRAGKTDRLAAPVVAYEAVLGGHEDYRGSASDRPIVCLQIAQDTRMAKYSLHSIHSVLKSMAFLKVGSPTSWIKNVTADRIELKNGVHIAVTPPTVKSIRGYDSPVGVLDEVGVWYQDADSANPDFEIYDQVNSRQAQFRFPKIVGISSPWNRGGILHARFEAGTNGSKIICDDCRAVGVRGRVGCPGCVLARAPHAGRLIIHTTTAVSNPIVTKAWLSSSLAKDPRAFERECLARFQDSLSGFLPSALIEKARARGVISRPPVPGMYYIAAIDPAFRRDAFGFTIVHADPEKGIVQDYVQRWFDPTGAPQDPGTLFAAIAQVLKTYRVSTVYTDQYSLETLQFIAQQNGFSLEEVTFSSESKAEIYGNLQQLLRQQRISLLDDDEQIKELKSIERKLTPQAKVIISAPEGMHDDLATVIAIAANEAIWMLPKVAPAEKPVPGMIERHIELVVRNKARSVRAAVDGEDW